MDGLFDKCLIAKTDKNNIRTNLMIHYLLVCINERKEIELLRDRASTTETFSRNKNL